MLDFNIMYALNKKLHDFEKISIDNFGYHIKCSKCSTVGRIFINPVHSEVSGGVEYIHDKYVDFECKDIIIKNIIE